MPAATPAVKVAWIEAVAKLGVKSQAGAILARLQSDPQASVRVAALAALQTLAVPELEPGMRAAMADADIAVRTAAIAALPEMPLAAPAKVEMLSAVVGKGNTAEQQSAVRALGKVPGNEAVQALGRLADGLATGVVAPAVQLDLLEAMQATKAAPLQAAPRPVEGRPRSGEPRDGVSCRADDGWLTAARPSDVPAARRGAVRTMPRHRRAVQAEVGPALAGVGSRLTRQQLLESLITPSARLAPGYGQVSVDVEERAEARRHVARGVDDDHRDRGSRRGGCSESRWPTSRRAPTACRRCRP